MGETKNSAEFDNSRRDFLRKLGIALGGVAIGGGGALQNARGQAAIPNGYHFYKLLATDTSGPAWGVTDVTPAVMVGNYNSIGNDPYSDVLYFHGANSAAKPAAFRVYVNYGQTKPVLDGVAAIAAQGDSLYDVTGAPSDQLPIVIGNLGAGSSNSQGNYATTIAVEDTGENTSDGSIQLKSSPGVYLYNPATKAWSKTARFGDPSPDGGYYGGIFGDVVLNDDNSVTFVAATTASPSSTTLSAAEGGSTSRTSQPARVPGFIGSHAVIHADSAGPAAVLLKTGDMLPGTTAMIECFGLIDTANGEHFIAQVTARRVDVPNAQSGTAVVQGSLKQSRWGGRTERLTLHAASRHLLPRLLIAQGRILIGESIIGPRVGTGGLAAIVTHNEGFSPRLKNLGRHRLTTIGRNGRNLITQVQERYRPRAVGALGAPVVSSQAPLTYVTELLNDGTTQLVVTDGTTRQVILKSGDSVEGVTITEINHGYHPAQVDVAGRLAFSAEFLRDPKGDPQDPNNIITALIVGIPV